MFLFKIYDVQIGIDKLKDKSKFLEVNMILETERLYLREMNQSDFESLCKILQDEDTMYAYEGAFNVDEVQEWLDRQIFRYQEWNFGLWAVILKETNQMIGQCGLTMQPWKDENVLEIGYLFERTYWHKGYAIMRQMQGSIINKVLKHRKRIFLL